MTRNRQTWWYRGDNSRVRVSDMTQSHLDNAAQYVRRHCDEGPSTGMIYCGDGEWNPSDYDPSEDPWHGRMYAEWLVILEEEQSRRNSTREA